VLPLASTGIQDLAAADSQRRVFDADHRRTDPANYVCIFPFKAESAKEVMMAVGDVARVSVKHESGWWKAEVRGSGMSRTGFVPSTFLYR
jgi:Variant SH3 domain